MARRSPQDNGSREHATENETSESIYDPAFQTLAHNVSLKAWFEHIALNMDPQYFLTIHFPEHMTFRTVHKRLNEDLRDMQQLTHFKQAILAAGILVQGQEHIHTHLLIRLLRDSGVFLTMPRYKTIYRPQMQAFTNRWPDAKVRLIDDSDRAAAYIVSPRNAKHFTINGVSQSELYFFNAKRLNRLMKNANAPRMTLEAIHEAMHALGCIHTETSVQDLPGGPK